VRLDPCRNRTQLPILAGGWPVLVVGLDLSGIGTVSDRTCGPVRYPREGKPAPPVIVPPPRPAPPRSALPPTPL